MKRELYLAILLFILMPSATIYSQVADISSIGSLIGGANQNQLPEPESNTTNESEEEMPLSKQLQESDFEDGNYGYTGGKNFVNPPQEKFFDEPLSYFGYDFFINAPSTFSPANTPVPPDYLLGPNDNVRIDLFGNKNNTWQLRVTSNGELFLPGIGPIAVTGQSFLDFEENIQQIITDRMIGTKGSVTMGKLRSINIFVLGEAYQPGMYTVSSLTTLTNAIFKSGGVNVSGSLRNIQLKRKGKVISTFDFYDLLLKGDTSKDTRLMQGDVVFIPPIGQTVGLAGEVGRPGIYELKENETFGDLIQLAGNLKPKADIFTATLSRVDPLVKGFSLIPVTLNDSSLESMQIKNGDVLSVYPIADNLKNAVLLTGHAKQPGFYPWKPEMRIGDLLKSSDGFLSMTDLNYVLIKREDKVSQGYTFLQTDLVDVLRNPLTDANLVLSERDEIILFPSLLNQDQITTRLIQDKYILEDNKMVLAEDEWTSMTYLRKSLMEQQPVLKDDEKPINPLTGEEVEDPDIRRYYEYSVYDYCIVPEGLAVDVIESAGFSAKKSIPVEDLEEIKTPDQFQSLLADIRTESLKTQATAKLATNLTRLCREQLLDPVIEIIKIQNQSNDNEQSFSNKEGLVSIFGNVQFPGSYPFTENMMLKDSIKAAGGSKNATYESEIELSRSRSEGKQYTYSQSFVSMSDEVAMQTRLQEMDIITLKQMAMNTGTAEITGEVFFAGVYPISENQTLGELVRRAGGITNNASIKGAYFVRKSLQQAELLRLEGAKTELRRKILLSSQAAGLGQTGLDGGAITQLTALLGNENEETTALGRLVLDLESILSGALEDIVLEDGDKLHIPTGQQTISVIGEVYVANSHLYKKNLTLNDYINLSGGANEYADESKIYLIKEDGSIVSPSQLSGSAFFRRASADGLQPGDTIVVPLIVQPFSGAKAATELTQIIYQMAIAAAAVNSF